MAALIVLFTLSMPQTVYAGTALDDLLTSSLAHYDLPAIAVAVVKDDKIVSAAAVGTRRAGADIPITLQDKFHIGSDTKAMTALLAGMLVDEGKLQWTSTIGDVFPELADELDPGLAKATVEQLLSHTSGIEDGPDRFFKLLADSLVIDGNLDEVRYWLLKQRASQPLDHAPGKFSYSNFGYVIVGCMIERLAGTTWEEMITERIFKPLGMRTAGLGTQASVGRVDAALPHRIVDGKAKAILAGPNSDNPLVIGPAGTAHMSVEDFSRWAAWNAGQGKHAPHLVTSATLRRLHAPIVSMSVRKDAPPGTPSRGEYGLGWGLLTVDWAPYPLVYHGGSNEMNLAHIWLDPERDFAIVTMTNIGGEKASEALFSIAKELYSGEMAFRALNH